jgi:hypothetical protein
MLSKFSNEVLSRGPSAVLPQNLSDFWLQALQELCDDFLNDNFALDRCTESQDSGDPVLVACVHEALGNRDGADTTPGELAEKVTVYALSITMETIRRESDIQMQLPTLDDLLSIDRIIGFGKINPEFGRFLRRACVIAEGGNGSDGSLFGRVKEKILSRITL